MQNYLKAITAFCVIPVALYGSITNKEAYIKEQQERIDHCKARIEELHPLLKQAAEDMRKYELTVYRFLRNSLQDAKNIAEIYEIIAKFNGKEKTDKELEETFTEAQKFFETTIKPTFLSSGPEEAGLTIEEFQAPITLLSFEKIKSEQDFKKLLWKYAAIRTSSEFLLFLNTFNQLQKYALEMAKLNALLCDAERELETLK